MSIIPIDNQDIYYYALNNGLEFLPFENSIMIEMSRAYVNQSHDKNPRAKRPYKNDVNVNTTSSFIESLKKIAVKKWYNYNKKVISWIPHHYE